MTKRERLIRAIKRKSVDRLPTTYRASEFITRSLIQYFNLHQEQGEIVNHLVLKHLGADFYSSGSKVDKLSTYTPKDRGPKPVFPYISDSQMFYLIGINTILQKDENHNVDHEIYVKPPWSYYLSPQEIDVNLLMARLDAVDFAVMKEQYIKEHLNGRVKDDEIICMGKMNSFFMICIYLRGFEAFLMDLALNNRMAKYITEVVSDFCLEFNRRELEAFGNYADYYGSWDDVASQEGSFLSPSLYERYVLPFYKKLIDQVKCYDLFFGWHCCGSVHDVLPLMINAGIDVFDVVQTSARNMDLKTIYNLYGREISFHGGIDVQKLLIQKQPDDIKKEVRKTIELWGERGGMILAPSHEIQPGTPIENILTIYELLSEG